MTTQRIRRRVSDKVENYNERYNSHYTSSEDDCIAMILNNHSDTIATQNKKTMVRNNQVTILLDSETLFTKDLATPIL